MHYILPSMPASAFLLCPGREVYHNSICTFTFVAIYSPNPGFDNDTVDARPMKHNKRHKGWLVYCTTSLYGQRFSFAKVMLNKSTTLVCGSLCLFPASCSAWFFRQKIMCRRRFSEEDTYILRLLSIPASTIAK